MPSEGQGVVIRHSGIVEKEDSLGPVLGTEDQRRRSTRKEPAYIDIV